MQYRRNTLGGLAGGVFLIGLALAFFLQHQYGGNWFLPVFFVALAFCVLIGSASSFNPRGVMGGLTGFFWMLVLAAFFLTGSWLWFLVGAGISAIVGSLWGPMGRSRYFMYGQQRSPFQQPYQSYQPTQPYQQGYQPSQQAPGTYQEGEQQYQYPQPHEDYPQAQHSQEQEMPPQQQ